MPEEPTSLEQPAPTRISDWYLRPPTGISRSRASADAWVCVAGTVCGHPKMGDGKRVTTSAVVRVDGRRFWTASGGAYVVDGEPLPQHIAWLNNLGRRYEPERPLAVLEGRKS